MNQKTDLERRLRLQNSQIEDCGQTLNHLILTRNSVNLKIMEIFNVLIVFKFIQNFSLTLMVVSDNTFETRKKYSILQNWRPHFLLKKKVNNTCPCCLSHLWHDYILVGGWAVSGIRYQNISQDSWDRISGTWPDHKAVSEENRSTWAAMKGPHLGGNQQPLSGQGNRAQSQASKLPPPGME